MATTTGIHIKRKDVDFESGGMTALGEFEVLVGIPEEKTERKNVEGGDEPVTNAMIAFIQDQGAPEKNIPQREFMKPGVENAMEPIVEQLRRGLNAALRDDLIGVQRAFNSAGIAAQRGIQNKIKEGVPPPLSDRTLQERARKGREGAKLELERRAAGEEPSTDLATPLIDTTEMLQSIKYVVRDKGERE